MCERGVKRERKKERGKKNNDVAGHVSPNRREIYFADSAHGTTVLPKERIGIGAAGSVKRNQAIGGRDGS